MFGPATWNSLPVHVRQSQCLVTFKKQVKTYLFTKHLSQSEGRGEIGRERGEREGETEGGGEREGERRRRRKGTQ